MARSRTDRPRYRRISTKLWADDKVRRLSAPPPSARYLWLFLLTGPHTGPVPGLFSIGEAALAEMLEWPLAGFRRVWRELEALGMCKADWRARLVWLPAAVKHNPPENPNVIVSWRAELDDLPECSLKVEALAAIGVHCERIGEAFAKAWHQVGAPIPPVDVKGLGEGFPQPFPKPFDDTPRKGSGNQDQDQDQEQEQEYARGKPFREPEPKAVLLERFDRFYARYPRQEQREPARMVWLEMAPSERTTAQILASLEAHRRTKRWADAIAASDFTYVPLAKKWLRERHWLEAPTADGSTSQRTASCRHRHAPPCASDADCTARYLADLRADDGASVGIVTEAVS